MGRYIRVYAFCTRLMSDGSIYDYLPGSITVQILNLYNNSFSDEVELRLKLSPDAADKDAFYDIYQLTSYPRVVN